MDRRRRRGAAGDPPPSGASHAGDRATRGSGVSAGTIEAEVHLWHGLRDPLVPIEHALQLAVTIPRCRVFFDPDEGHHFFRRRLRTILSVLLGHQEDAGDEPAVTLDGARTIAGHRVKRPRR